MGKARARSGILARSFGRTGRVRAGLRRIGRAKTGFGKTGFSKTGFSKTGFSKTGLTRAALTLLIALAFSVQSIVVNSHVHVSAGAEVATATLAQEASAKASLAAVEGNTAHPARAPANNDPASCVICLQMAMAGVAVLPASAPPPRLVTKPISAPPLIAAALVRAASSHAWRSRAPPVQI